MTLELYFYIFLSFLHSIQNSEVLIICEELSHTIFVFLLRKVVTPMWLIYRIYFEENEALVSVPFTCMNSFQGPVANFVFFNEFFPKRESLKLYYFRPQKTWLCPTYRVWVWNPPSVRCPHMILFQAVSTRIWNTIHIQWFFSRNPINTKDFCVYICVCVYMCICVVFTEDIDEGGGDWDYWVGVRVL